MKKELKFKVNGQPYDIFVEPKKLLVEVLRDLVGLTGTKRGCNSSSCGACTVMLNGMSVKSCSVLALQANGAEVTENPKPTKLQIKEGIDGNICRCTGYNAIVRAVTAVVKGEYKEAK